MMQQTINTVTEELISEILLTKVELRKSGNKNREKS